MRNFVYGRVKESPRTAIYVIRVKDEALDAAQANDLAATLRDKLLSRGEYAIDIVVVQGGTKETLRLHGTAYSVGRVRAAMFNAAITWMPIELD